VFIVQQSSGSQTVVCQTLSDDTQCAVGGMMPLLPFFLLSSATSLSWELNVAL